MTEQRKILFIDEFTGLGGAEVVLLQFIQWAEAQTDESAAFEMHAMLSGRGTFSERLESHAIPIYFVDLLTLKERWKNPFCWLGVRTRIKAVLDRVQPDIIIVNSLWALSATWWPVRRSGYPVIAAIHSSVNPKRENKRKLFTKFGSFLLQLPEKYVAVSDRLKTEICDLGVSAGKVEIIPNGVDIAQYSMSSESSGFRTQFHIPADKPLIGVIGRLHPGKGQETFILAAERVLETIADVRFVIIGEENITPSENLRFTSSLRGMIKQRGLENNVHLTGYVKDSASATSACDIIVSTSREESFGLAVLEGMASGKPVVATSVAGHCNLIEQGVSGLLYTIDDDEKLAERLIDLLGDEGLRTYLGGNASERARAFDLNHSMTKWCDLIGEVAGKAGDLR